MKGRTKKIRKMPMELIELKNKVIYDMKSVFGNDNRRINHALNVLNYAEQISNVEACDSLIVAAAAILHDIGIQQAEKKYNSNAGKYQEIEGPPIAEEILKRYDFPKDSIAHICKIIANHHSARDIDTKEFRCVWDADWLVNIPDEYPNIEKSRLVEIIKKVFKTDSGLKIAIEKYIN
jgi:putative nucleotidyltransferase with HDIG domain